MDQKLVWNKLWLKGGKGGVNDFARKSFSKIKKRSFQTLLDLGCGTGEDALYFAEQGLEVTAVDFSASGLAHLNKRAKEKNLKNVRTIEADICDLKLDTNSFDVIYSHLGLHYFDDETTSAIFENLNDMLKKDGLLFIKCKSVEDSLYGKGERIEKDMFCLDGHVRHFFSMEYMKEKLRKFRILDLRKTSAAYHGYSSHFIEVVATKE